MVNEKKAIEANEKFYEAFNKQNFELMRQVWLEDYSIACIHPGWKVLRGTEAVMQSWRGIFQNPSPLDIRLGDVEATASADLAWVSCQENLYVISPNGVLTSKVHASNIFQQVDGEWKMIMHHASNLPGEETVEARVNIGGEN